MPSTWTLLVGKKSNVDVENNLAPPPCFSVLKRRHAACSRTGMRVHEPLKLVGSGDCCPIKAHGRDRAHKSGAHNLVVSTAIRRVRDPRVRRRAPLERVLHTPRGQKAATAYSFIGNTVGDRVIFRTERAWAHGLLCHIQHLGFRFRERRQVRGMQIRSSRLRIHGGTKAREVECRGRTASPRTSRTGPRTLRSPGACCPQGHPTTRCAHVFAETLF